MSRWRDRSRLLQQESFLGSCGNKQLLNGAFGRFQSEMESTTKPGTATVPQYNLKWTNHTNNILQMFSDQLLKESLVDVTLTCDGHFVKAHKMILSACSVYFQEMFEVHTVQHPLIIMHGMRFNDLKQVIDFMYHGEIKVADCDLDHLLALAENLQVKGLCNVRTKTAATKIDIPPPESSKEIIPRGKKRRKTPHTEKVDTPVENQNSDDTGATENVKTKPFLPTSQELAGAGKRNSTSTPDLVEEGKKIMLEISEMKKARLTKMGENKSDPPHEVPLSEELKNKLVDKEGPKIPRPPNAFMIFANEWRKRLASENVGENNKEISVRLGNMWKSLPTATKDIYYSAARKADEEHKIKYPGYYYSPKEARMRKELKSVNASIRKKGGTEAVHLVKLIMPETIMDECDIKQELIEEDIMEPSLHMNLEKMAEPPNK